MSIQKLYSVYLQFPEIVTDTRKIIPGSIFFALRGPNFNANLFAEEALNKGAAYAVVDDASAVKNEKFILVNDVLETLQELARHHRAQLKIPVFALTGSNGKTTTKELIHAALSQQFNTLATKGNLNNHIGVPLTLLSIRKEHQFAIIEMGANHCDEIKFLCGIAQPDSGMITNIGKAHIEGFGSEEGIKKGKGELFDYLRAKKGTVFVNGNSGVLMEISEGMNRLLYGNKERFYVTGDTVLSDPLLTVGILENGTVETISTQLVGRYNTENVLAAVAIAKHFGLSLSQIKKGIESYVPDNNRSQILKKGNNTIVMDAYNANPSSMRAALENFAAMSSDKKFFIIGDMLELGHASAGEHQKIIELAESLHLNGIYIGPFFNAGKFHSSASHFSTTAEAKSFLEKNIPENALLLIKGSRGMKLESLLEIL